MVPIQPTNLWLYLGRNRLNVPSRLIHYFYTSWEDALWNLLLYFKIKPGSVALVPSFFCGDVINNMADHGLKSVFYPVSKTLQSDPVVFKKYLEKSQPQVVIIFHPVGITNTLWKDKKVWLSALPKKCLLIEDSVHRIVDPATLKLISERHVVIDSLRKVVPIPGANLYLHRRYSDLSQYQQQNPSYRFGLLGWWLLFQLCLLSTLLPFGSAWLNFWNKHAEWAMLKGYDLIGDYPTGTVGWGWANWLASHLDIAKITQSKEKQTAHYLTHLLPVITKKNSPFFSVPFLNSDAGQLRGFPLGLKLNAAQQVLSYLRREGLLTRFELNDSPWSRQQKIIYLPLGPHLHTQQLNWVSQLIGKAAIKFASP